MQGTPPSRSHPGHRDTHIRTLLRRTSSLPWAICPCRRSDSLPSGAGTAPSWKQKRDWKSGRGCPRQGPGRAHSPHGRGLPAMVRMAPAPAPGPSPISGIFCTPCPSVALPKCQEALKNINHIHPGDKKLTGSGVISEQPT